MKPPSPVDPLSFVSAGDPAESREPLVQLERLVKRYGAKVAVRDMTLTLFSGEVFAFLGPNGAGKTSTLRMTTGLLRPDAGRVRVCGFDMRTDARRAKRHLAYVPDLPFLYDKLTGREFIEFAREMYGVPRELAAKRLEELIDRLDMNSFLDQLTESYSHGMKQKTALAAALIHAPRVLIVDEPIVGLDPRTVRVIKDIFREIASAGGVVFMSTHTLDVAEAVADRIGIIRSGELVGLGTLEELRRAAERYERLEDIFLHLTGEQFGDGDGDGLGPPRGGAAAARRGIP
ncbi:MAG: ABC transporter ATP-binding protein [Phycisphaerae bacterium]